MPTDVRWAQIMEDHKADVSGREEEVRAAIERPNLVTVDKDDARRECHYLHVGPGRRQLEVVVRYEAIPPPGRFMGEVRTAYFTFRILPAEVPL